MTELGQGTDIGIVVEGMPKPILPMDRLLGTAAPTVDRRCGGCILRRVRGVWIDTTFPRISPPRGGQTDGRGLQAGLHEMPHGDDGVSFKLCAASPLV